MLGRAKPLILGWARRPDGPKPEAQRAESGDGVLAEGQPAECYRPQGAVILPSEVRGGALVT